MLKLRQALCSTILLICWQLSVYAHDCSSPGDCEQTAGYNTLIALIGGLLGTLAGLLGNALAGTNAVTDGGGEAAGTPGGVVPPAEPPKKEEERPKQPRKPCQDESERMTQARANAKVLLLSLQELRNIKAALDVQYENVRATTYGSGVIDIAFLAGSVLGKAPVKVGVEAAKETLQAKLFEAAVKAYYKEAFKDVVKILNEQNVNFADLIKKPAEDVVKKAVIEKLKESLTNRALEKVAGGLGTTIEALDKNFAEPLKQSIKLNYSGPLGDYFGNLLSVYKGASGVFSGKETLENIRQAINEINAKLTDAQLQFDSALADYDIAAASYRDCVRLHPEAGGEQ